MSEAENFNDRNPDDQFFGVSYPVNLDSEQLELEVVDEEQEQEQPEPEPKPKQEAQETDDDDDDDSDIDAELSERARRRIAKLTKKYREAERDRDEAFRAAQVMHGELNQSRELLSRGERALAEQIKSRAELAVERAKGQYKSAYEEGDPDKIIEAQEELLRAQTELGQAESYLSRSPERAPAQQPDSQAQQPAQQPAPTRQQPAQPHPKAQQWADNNPWFGDPQHPDMTALAYGVHEKALASGIEPNSEQYFRAIDSAVHRAFPEYFGDTGSQEIEVDDEKGGEPMPTQTRRRSPTTPAVAPATRSGGTRSTQVTLTPSMKALAKRLGLTPEQYAAQLLKEQKG